MSVWRKQLYSDTAGGAVIVWPSEDPLTVEATGLAGETITIQQANVQNPASNPQDDSQWQDLPNTVIDVDNPVLSIYSPFLLRAVIPASASTVSLFVTRAK